MKSSFKYPKVFADITDFYKNYFLLHPHLPKSFRNTTGHMILVETTAALKNIVLINVMHKQENKKALSIDLLQSVRGSMAVIRAMLNVGWQLKVISNGNVIKLHQQIDDIEKQITAWQLWFSGER